MCEICGYVGRKNTAAPILLEYGKRVEGLWSGFLTGIGVQDSDGTLDVRKCVGYSKYWEEKFDVSSMQGTVGLFHSRTAGDGSGDEHYGHPFISDDGSTMAVSQGIIGIFSGSQHRINEVGNMLLKQGRSFRSADDVDSERFFLLDNGKRVHISDVVTGLCDHLLEKYKDPFCAMRETALTIREESVTLFCFKEYPGHIFGINIDQRMCAYIHSDGISVATSSIAFGDERVNLVEIPGNSLFDITADGIRIEKLSGRFDLQEKVPSGMLAAARSWLMDNPGSCLVHIKDNVLEKNYPDGALCHIPTREIFEQLYFDGELVLKTEEQPGIRPQENSVVTKISCK